MAEVTFSGPLFDTAGDAILAEGTLAARHAVADRGAELTREAFEDRIQVNNGRFTSRFEEVDASTVFSSSPNGHKTYTMQVDVPEDTTTVTTSEAAYGPWLEGHGSRNATTRFKGYFGFERAASELDQQAQGIVEEALAPYIDKLNG